MLADQKNDDQLNLEEFNKCLSVNRDRGSMLLDQTKMLIAIRNTPLAWNIGKQDKLAKLFL